QKTGAEDLTTETRRHGGVPKKRTSRKIMAAVGFPRCARDVSRTLRSGCKSKSSDLQAAYIKVRSRDDGAGKYISSVLAAVRPQPGDGDGALDRAGGRVLFFRLPLHGGAIGGAGRTGHPRPADLPAP